MSSAPQPTRSKRGRSFAPAPFPYAFDGDRLLVAIADPGDVQAVDELRIATRRELVFAVAPREDIELELRNLERQLEATRRDAVEEDEDFSFEDEAEVAEDEASGPLVEARQLARSSRRPRRARATCTSCRSPTGSSSACASTVSLRELERIPRQRSPAVITRIKVLAKLDIAEHRRPQDGRISLRTSDRPRVDIRVPLLPSVEGEGAILRLLDKSRKPPTLTEIGLSFPMQMALEQVLNAPERRAARHGPDRLRQVDDALCGARRPRAARDQRDHDRGPRRVPAPRRSTSCRSTRRSTSTSRRRCARCCAATPTW